MDKIDNDNIDLGQWTVPTKWEDITLKQFADIHKMTEGDDHFDVRKVLSILTNHTEDEINALPIEFAETILTHLSFLETKPEIGDPRPWVEINGDRYEINTMQKMRTGEYIMADQVLKNDPKDFPSILAILCRKKDEPFDSHFEAEIFDERVKLFQNMPALEGLRLMNFFILSWMSSEGLSRLYMAAEEGLNLIQANIETSEELGAFKKYSMKRQVKTLRKSLRSNRPTSQTSSIS